MPDYGTTPISSLLGVRVDELPPVPCPRFGVARTARALVRLARAHHRLAHLPTVGQVRSMAWFDGREPCSYLDALDRRRAEIARRYIRRLALEPYLGVPVERGCWASTGAGESTSTPATGLMICSGGGGRRYAAATRTSARALGGGSSTGSGRRRAPRFGSWWSLPSREATPSRQS